jgi:diketogulonate reductase-like aldo/keto reductase
MTVLFCLSLLLTLLCLGLAENENYCRDLPTKTLHNGVELPVFSLGTAQLIHKPNIYPDAPQDFAGFLTERGYRQTELSLQKGLRSFDSAYIYRSHQALGRVLGEWWRVGKIKREDVFLVTKVFHPAAESAKTDIAFQSVQIPNLDQLSPKQVEETVRLHFEQSLRELGVGYVDLMLLHWPGPWQGGKESTNRHRRIAAWKVLEEMYEKRWARAIGVSNFCPKHLEQLKQDGASIVPMVNQFEASVTLQYTDILDYCQQNNIVPQAYSPLGRGVKDLPPLVSELARKYSKDEAQICFRYLYQLGYAIVFMTNSPERMVSNTEIFEFELSPKEIEALSALHHLDGGWGLPNPADLK